MCVCVCVCVWLGALVVSRSTFSTPVCVYVCGSTGRIEKYILRKAFDTPEDPYLPKEVLWRQKEQFSDGVGYNWIDGLKAHADSMISDAQLAQAANRCVYAHVC